jgi:hypothetical protein
MPIIDLISRYLGQTNKPKIDQMKTDDFVKLSEITQRPYPMTNVTIKFADNKTRDAMVIRDDNAEEGPQNIKVEYKDGHKKTQIFTAADGEKIKIKIGEITADYRGGRKHKTLRNKKSMKSRKSKSIYKKPTRRNPK